MALQRISTELGARKIMQRLIDANRCALEDFDAPPPGHVNPTAYRNLLREPELGETVQVSNPRDFEPASGPTPAEQPTLPVTLEVDHTPTPSPDAYLEDLDF